MRPRHLRLVASRDPNYVEAAEATSQFVEDERQPPRSTATLLQRLRRWFSVRRTRRLRS